MDMTPILPVADRGCLLIVRMLRRWRAAHDSHSNPLTSMVALAQGLGQSPHAAVALHSLFQLTEACLGRRLVSAPVCGHALSSDERAVMLLITYAPAAAAPAANSDIPHGLPGALHWATVSVRLALGIQPVDQPALRPDACPFSVNVVQDNCIVDRFQKARTSPTSTRRR